MSDEKLGKIIAYNEFNNAIEQQHEAELHQPDSASWTFKKITEDQGPLNLSDRCYIKGSFYNVLVHWEDGSETFEPLFVLSHAQSMPRTTTFLKSQDGNDSSTLPFALYCSDVSTCQAPYQTM
jgi:hypothetical protein